MLNIGDIVKFILENRNGSKAFHNYSEQQIVDVVLESLKNNEAAIVLNESQTKIQGFVHGRIFDENVFHIYNLLTDGSVGVIKSMLTIFDKNFPGMKLEGTRYGKLKLYKHTNRFKQHLNNLT